MTTDTLATVDDTELGQLRRACASYVEVVAARDAEIKRLGDAVKFLNSFRPDAELAKRDAEIERLREERKDQDAEVISQFAKIVQMRAEIERLRGLLMEVWNWSIGGPTGVSSDLFERVREALGE